jgi:hypothetical protein|tara:strand:- start:2127 stop:2318 length:192 start_codon:yes stop_codon:yes gene_type:complete
MDLNNEELDRAFRISFIINENHLLLNSIYESLVDREFVLAQKDIKIIISDLRSIIKSIDEDDF